MDDQEHAARPRLDLTLRFLLRHSGRCKCQRPDRIDCVLDFRHASSIFAERHSDFCAGINSYAHAINDNGDIVGSTAPQFGFQPFTYSNGTTSLLPIAPASQGGGYDINNAGQVAGDGFSGHWSPVIYGSNGPTLTLSTVTGSASAINDAGTFVGHIYIDQAQTLAHAFVYSSGTLTDLNNVTSLPTGWALTDAHGINSNGQIIGSATNQGGQTRAFLLTPINVPVPSQAPSITSFPNPTSIYSPTLTSFIQNHGSAFSPDSQQFLVANSTPSVVQANISWKQISLASGHDLQFAGNLTDLILGGQSAGNAAEYVALQVLPAKYQNFASSLDIIGHLGFDIATKANPELDLISANSFIWGQLVAPQLVSLGEDPPDPNYTSAVVVTGFPNVSLPTSGPSLTATLAREFVDASHAAVYLQAANTAYNRYSTALENTDSISAGLQLESALYYMNMYREAISGAASDVATANAMLPGSGLTNESYDSQGFTNLQAEIQSSGLPPSTTSFLEGLGLPADDIDQTTQNILALDPNSYSGDLYSELSQVGSAITVPEPKSFAITAFVGMFFVLRSMRRPKKCPK